MTCAEPTGHGEGLKWHQGGWRWGPWGTPGDISVLRGSRNWNRWQVGLMWQHIFHRFLHIWSRIKRVWSLFVNKILVWCQHWKNCPVFSKILELWVLLHRNHSLEQPNTNHKVLSTSGYNFLLTRELSCSENPAQIMGFKSQKISPWALNPVYGFVTNGAEPFLERKLGERDISPLASVETKLSVDEGGIKMCHRLCLWVRAVGTTARAEGTDRTGTKTHLEVVVTHLETPQLLLVPRRFLPQPFPQLCPGAIRVQEITSLYFRAS